MNRRTWSLLVIGLAAAISLSTLATWGQTKSRRPVRRAKPPQWQPQEMRGVFFDNVFDGKVLAGERPANFHVAASGSKPAASAGGAPDSSVAAVGGSGWSKVIAAATIEDEIKALKQLVDKNVTTPTEFAGKGYKEARRNFTVLAMLFGIIGEYDGDVRWKGDAPSAREAFARTAANAKVGTQQVFNEAKLRRQDLEDLLSGSGLATKTGAEAKVSWSQTCDRSPLMLRLDMSLPSRLQPWTASKGDFQGKKDEIAQEAQLVAAIGQVLGREGMADADAAEYQAFCRSLEKAALEIVDAIKLDNDEMARKAVGQISKSCDDCHNAYR